MKKGIIVSSAIIFIVLWTCYANGEPSNQAIKALKKIEARVQYGINYKDYLEVLSEAKVEVSSFLESQEAKEKPKAESIKRTFDHYERAYKFWRLNEEGRKQGAYKNNDIDKEMLKYPEIRKHDLKSPSYVLDIKWLLDLIWKDASNELQKAIRLLPPI